MAQAVFTPKWLPTTDVDGLSGRKVLISDAKNQKFLLRLDKVVGERPGTNRFQWTYTDRVKVGDDYQPGPDVLVLERSTHKKKYDAEKQREYTRRSKEKKRLAMQPPPADSRHSTRAGAPVQRERKGKGRGWFSRLLGRKGGR